MISTRNVSSILSTLAAIIQIGSNDQTSHLTSVSDLPIPLNSSLAIIPFKGQGQIVIQEPDSLKTLTILPGQIFGIFESSRGMITNLDKGFFTTEKTELTFAAGTSYGIVNIGANGQVLEIDSYKTVLGSLILSVPLGSTIGVLQLTDEKEIASIGGALFTTRPLTHSISNGSPIVGTTVGILDISTYLASTAITTPIISPTTTYTVGCNLNELHRYPSDCSRFYQCYSEASDLTVFVFPCAPSLYFDEGSSQCLIPSETSCDTNISDSKDSATDLIYVGLEFGGSFQLTCTGNLLRYPLNCGSFYRCSAVDNTTSTITITNCPTDLVFDEESAQCVAPESTSACTKKFVNLPTLPASFQSKEAIDIRTIVQQTTKTKTSKSSSKEIAFIQKVPGIRSEVKSKVVQRTPVKTAARLIPLSSEIYGARTRPRSAFGKNNHN